MSEDPRARLACERPSFAGKARDSPNRDVPVDAVYSPRHAKNPLALRSRLAGAAPPHLAGDARGPRGSRGRARPAPPSGIVPA